MLRIGMRARDCVVALALLSVLGGSLLGGCSDSVEPLVQTGGDGQLCNPDGSCDAGLGCNAAGRCQQETSFGDCRDVALSCYPPFVCKDNPKTGSKACLSAGAAPTCTDTPAGQVVPFNTAASGGGPLGHWTSLQGCIATSYDPRLSARLAAIAAALEAWTQVSCSTLCFSGPVPSDAGVETARGERRLHFALGTSPQPGVYAWVLSNLEGDTGRFKGVEIQLDEQGHVANVEDSDFLQLVGLASGLGIAPAGTDSVMAPATVPRTITALSANDNEAFCKLYGQPSYCGD
jgi:hypothetical protein